MGFNVFMTRQKVIEKYGIAPELEQEVFAVLKPVGGSGINAQYLESRVDQQLEKYFASKERPALAAVKSYLNEEDKNMIVASDRAAGGPLLKTRQAAQYLAISERQLQYEVERGNIAFVRVGKSGIRFTNKDLDGYVNRYRTAASATACGGAPWQA